MARIVAVDYGKKRTGVAVTDTLQIIANGLCTVATQDLFSFLLSYIKKEDVELIVMGLPKQPNGETSENFGRIDNFFHRWENAKTGVKMVYYDERFTSVLAHRAMLEGGLKRKARQDKALVDEISATIILQDYLESRR